MKQGPYSQGEHFRQFGLFIIVGALNTGLDAGLYLTLTRSLGMKPLIASMFSFLAGSVNSFLMNKRWTFGHPSTRVEALRQYGKFFTVSLFVLGLHQLSLLIIHHGLGFSDLPAKGCGILTGVLSGFMLNKYWVFRWSHTDEIGNRHQPDAVPS